MLLEDPHRDRSGEGAGYREGAVIDEFREEIDQLPCGWLLLCVMRHS